MKFEQFDMIMNNHEQINYKRLTFNPIMFYTLHRSRIILESNVKYDVFR